ncbi:hypothetical protein PN498_17965 [Oscillatoria sp. CS-180]|uniref:hypothetical protein n=1 Tax=Oscillatoria sp. CS-180 TaxID=3021720 RepID=UPI00232CA733|nr:hypothetical protein [Oscillatoria sp. CS-180]MDB9527886.1 hypothetical protein [Oscillatoria sp. CS-180]
MSEKLLYLSLPFLLMFTMGCSDPMILMNDSERSLMEAQQREAERPPAKDRSIRSVKSLTREFEICTQLRSYPSLSVEIIESISQGNDNLIQDKLAKESYECSTLSSSLFEKLATAQTTGNSQDEIYQAMLEGQAEALRDPRLRR